MKCLLTLCCLFSTIALSQAVTITDQRGIVHGTGLIAGKMGGFGDIYDSTVLSNLPDSYDLRADGKVSPIKDQGQCGSCWAHATVESLEDAILFTGGAAVKLSTQQMTSCNTEMYGCNGGMMNAADFLVSPGMALEKDFPYTASDERCKNGLKTAAKAASWAYVGAAGRAPTTTEIKSALVAHGSVFVTVSAGGNDWDGRSEMTDCYNTGTNHMTEVVGWNEKSEWIMRNSWGTGWGDKGFAYMPFGCDSLATDVDSAAYTIY